ncbi:MAG: amidohydrolase family protein [Bacteroidia bacterium]
MQFLKADAIFDGEKFLGPHEIIAIRENGTIKEIVPENVTEEGNIQKLKGVITPGFVNAHCHTELSHLKNKIPQKTGLPSFGKHIIFQRASCSAEEIKERVHEADKEMLDNGIVAVGDICNTEDSFEMKTKSSIYYHSFIELLGLDAKRAEIMYDAGLHFINKLNVLGLPGSLTPHAPYSTSTELIRKIAEYNLLHDLPASIHNQESEEETKFFNGEKSGFHDLYDFLNVDISWFKAPGTSSLAYYIDSLLDQKTLLVHNTCTSKKDIELTVTKNISWCFCPGANKYIEDRLPNFGLFSTQANRLCLGTDSLASNTGLSLVNEANAVLEHSSYTIDQVLQMMTSNGANALNMGGKFGKLLPGINAGLNLMEINDRKFKFIKKLNPLSL